MRNKTLLIGIVLGLTISLTIGGFAAMYTQSAYAIRGITGAGEGPGNGFHPGPANTPPHPHIVRGPNVPPPCSGTGTIEVPGPGGSSHPVRVPICNG